jgi:hypothetical protein
MVGSLFRSSLACGSRGVGETQFGTGFQLHWESAPEDRQARAKKAASKTRFTYPECGQNAWAKPDALLICGNCHEDGQGETILTLAEPARDDEPAAEQHDSTARVVIPPDGISSPARTLLEVLKILIPNARNVAQSFLKILIPNGA